MKIVFALLALATTAVYAQTEPDCPATEITKLAPIAKPGASYQKCKPFTLGFTFIPIVGTPNATQLAAMCAEPTCATAITEIRNIATLSDCLLVNAQTKAKFNVFRFARDYDISCAPYTTAPTTAPPTTTPTTAPPTTTPTTAPPTTAPTTAPTVAPTSAPPTKGPTTAPTTAPPTKGPTTAPTSEPTVPVKPSC